MFLEDSDNKSILPSNFKKIDHRRPNVGVNMSIRTNMVKVFLDEENVFPAVVAIKVCL